MKNDRTDFSGCGCLIAGALFFAAVIATPTILAAFIEARAFNRATGHEISMWDAMFVELRVEGRAK